MVESLNNRASLKKYSIGRHSYAGKDLRVMDWNNSKLVIGNFCSIAEGVTIMLGGEHNIKWITTSPIVDMITNSWHSPPKYAQSRTKGNVTIGNDVLISYGVTILSGVNIGDGSIIGAKCLVTKDVPAYSIVAGIPNEIIRYRYTTPIINQLLKIQWWNWDDNKIIDNKDLLMSENIEEFINKNVV